MFYPITIEPGNEKEAFGVVIPDLPGCFSAGDTLEEAYANAQEAAIGWIEMELDDGHDIPSPSTLDAVAKNPDYKGWILGFVDVPADLLSTKTERINITIPQRILRRLDIQAQAAGDSRSGYIARMVLEHSMPMAAAR